jgi:hypothetical protein
VLGSLARQSVSLEVRECIAGLTGGVSGAHHDSRVVEARVRG